MGRRDPHVNYAELERVESEAATEHPGKTVKAFPCDFDRIAIEVHDPTTKTGRVYAVEGQPYRRRIR